MTDKFLPKLSQNLLEILDDEEYHDTKIEVGNDPNVKIFRAHMVILSYRSPYLRRILSTNKSNDGTLARIELPNILPEIFQTILRYIYGGILSLEDYDATDIIKILIAASELSLQELILHLQSFLIKHKVNWMIQNFSLIYQTSFRNNSFLELQKFCMELISKKPERIFKSPEFTSIPEKSLISLIQNNNICMSVAQVWEHVLKWGIAQNPELSSDHSNYSKDDFIALRKTLQHCIPFIRFRNLTPKEFSSKVLPYKKVIPKESYKNLIKYFLDHDYNNINKSEPQIIKEICSKSIDSTIISDQHVELISKWIDKLDDVNASDTETLASMASKSNSLYEFKLLFRGPRDGLTPDEFYEICDNQSFTVIVIKVKNSNEILGGYNPISWYNNPTYGITNDSFIFSFKDKNDYILSRVKDPKFAIVNSTFYGPSFGNGDLILRGNNFYNNSYCSKHSYERAIRETEGPFSVKEYEVFQIVKNSF
ncbi:unnamed protein product [Rhizophagus irregularis]|nr:unnamed protein product [Rhizophagus irregularis]